MKARYTELNACKSKCVQFYSDFSPFSIWVSAPEFFNPTQDENFVAEYDRIVNALRADGQPVETEENVQIDMWVQSTDAAVWGTTTFACPQSSATCACLNPVNYQEITGRELT